VATKFLVRTAEHLVANSKSWSLQPKVWLPRPKVVTTNSVVAKTESVVATTKSVVATTKNLVVNSNWVTLTKPFLFFINQVPCEFRAPEDFLKWRYNLLDMSVMRVAYYGLDSCIFSL